MSEWKQEIDKLVIEGKIPKILKEWDQAHNKSMNWKKTTNNNNFSDLLFNLGH